MNSKKLKKFEERLNDLLSGYETRCMMIARAVTKLQLNGETVSSLHQSVIQFLQENSSPNSAENLLKFHNNAYLEYGTTVETLVDGVKWLELDVKGILHTYADIMEELENK